jgi:predicted metal-dependent phosphoesterase TrpH
LIEEDVVDNEQEAFDRFLTSGCEAYVSAEKHDAEDVIDTIHENGGVASLAHPGRDLTTENAEENILELIELGLDGMEVPYTYQHKLQQGYGMDFQQLEAKELYETMKETEPDFLMTGGSDCHGSGDPERYNLGKIELDTEYVDALRERSMEYR